MAFFLNTNIHDTKKINIALCNIYGINKIRALEICHTLGISENVKFYHLNDTQKEKISQLINENFHFGTELKQFERKQKTTLIKISSYKGFRHREHLPCRGQRTHTNANTVKNLRKKRK